MKQLRLAAQLGFSGRGGGLEARGSAEAKAVKSSSTTGSSTSTSEPPKSKGSGSLSGAGAKQGAAVAPGASSGVSQLLLGRGGSSLGQCDNSCSSSSSSLMMLSTLSSTTRRCFKALAEVGRALLLKVRGGETFRGSSSRPVCGALCGRRLKGRPVGRGARTGACATGGAGRGAGLVATGLGTLGVVGVGGSAMAMGG